MPDKTAQTEATLLEKSRPGRRGDSLPASDVPRLDLGQWLSASVLRQNTARLPELSEPEVVRHFTRLSQLNFSIDTHFYPLGSCTMKYNPRVNEVTSAYAGFIEAHPHSPTDYFQGSLRVMFELGEFLKEIAGMEAITLQPAAGAHGELTGLLMIRAYHEALGNPRQLVLIPDSAHGTNPATAALCGYAVKSLKTDRRGLLSSEVVSQAMNADVAALMITNPSTLGLFEKDIAEIANLVHAQGGLVYCDGANMNALMGVARPGDMGVDCMHFNLHKTFTTPHGGGGPGSGPVAVKKFLAPFLPLPVIVQRQMPEGVRFDLDDKRPQSIGRVHACFGNFGMLVRAYTYIRELGAEGIKRTCEMAVLNGNYVRRRLEGHYQLAFATPSLHEAVFSDKSFKGSPVKTLDVAKRLIDYGCHPPTVYFPLIISGALMIEPTETETQETLDHFCEAMIAIAREIQAQPELLTSAPHNTPVGRLDEVRAARQPVLREWS